MSLQYYLPPKDVIDFVEREKARKLQQIHVSYPLELIFEEIEKINKKLPESYDNMAKMLALSRPIIDVILLECGCFNTESSPGVSGRPLLSYTSLILIHLIAKIGTIGAYRQVERELNTRPIWLKALQLGKAPNHTTLSKFRKKMGEDFFITFFHKLAGMLFAFGLISKDKIAIIDSAPIEANQNFARSNAGVKINEKRLHLFFNTIDISPALILIAPHSGRGRKTLHSNEILLKFLIFIRICGFLSRSQALRHLKKHLNSAKILGFNPKKIPSSATVSNFLKRIPPLSFLMNPIMDSITNFFDEQPDYDENDPLAFFFWSV